MSDIALLFATDPLKLTRDDLTQIVAKFRENRALYISAGKSAAKATAEPKTPATPEAKAKAKAAAITLSLGDLGL